MGSSNHTDTRSHQLSNQNLSNDFNIKLDNTQDSSVKQIALLERENERLRNQQRLQQLQFENQQLQFHSTSSFTTPQSISSQSDSVYSIPSLPTARQQLVKLNGSMLNLIRNLVE